MNFNELYDQSEQITQSQLTQLEQYLDTLYGRNNIDFEFTRHFLDRVNDERNNKHITIDELKRMFGAAQQAYGQKMAKAGPDFEAVIRDVSTKINSPFALSWNRQKQQLELHAKTVMRKDNFKTPDPVLPVKTEAMERKLAEFKIRVNGDLARLESYRDLGMTNPAYTTLDEDIESMRDMLDRVTCETLESEFRTTLNEVSAEDEISVFQLALTRLNQIMPDVNSIQQRIAGAISASRTESCQESQTYTRRRSPKTSS